MKCACIETAINKLFGNLRRLTLGLGKDHGLAATLCLQDAANNLIFIKCVCTINELLDIGFGLAFVWVVGANVYRTVLVLARHGHDGARHGCREQHCLTTIRGVGKKFFNIWQEAKVQHFVGFI